MTIFFNILTVEEDEDPDAEIGSASKKRHSIKTVKVHKSSFNRCAYLYSAPMLLAFLVLDPYIKKT